jgi:xanthine phosphoribosyltransferase
MELLKERILRDGTIIENRILKVDSFINHQVDVKLFNEIGKEFRKRFEGEKIDKILTIETSGIAIASIAAQYFDFVPVVFAKKTESVTLDSNTYNSEVHSYTKEKIYTIKVSKNFIKEGERILILDDFLASGAAVLGLLDIIKQAGAETVAAGIVIEKGFQPGRGVLEEQGVRVESLVIIEKFDDNRICFK